MFLCAMKPIGFFTENIFFFLWVVNNSCHLIWTELSKTSGFILIRHFQIRYTFKELLTLNVWGPSYIRLTMSASWWLIPWLLPSPGHQQPWYWLCKLGRSLSYMRKDFNYICHINEEEWHKIKIHVYTSSEKFKAHKELRAYRWLSVRLQ